MKKIQFKDFKNQLDSVNEFQIIYLKEYELNAYNIKPRIKNNSRFSYYVRRLTSHKKTTCYAREDTKSDSVQ